MPIEEKVALLFAANEAALKVKGVRFVTSGLQLLREIKTLRELRRHGDDADVHSRRTVVLRDSVRRRRIPEYSEELAPRASGWEYIQSLDMPGNGAKWADLAVQKLGAKTVEPGRYDLILDPTNLWLTIHESIGHPTELDRAMGYEANYAGTSFVAPPEKQIGKLKYGTAS